jgi:hypothetical protein
MTFSELKSHGTSLLASRIRMRIYELEGRFPTDESLEEHGDLKYDSHEFTLTWRGKPLITVKTTQGIDQ